MNSCCKFKSMLNERGFSLIEMMIATTISLVLLSAIVFVFDQQSDTFSQQNEVSQMQANSRATVDLIARLVQNTGYNVTRGTRFLAASDHYIAAVYDENDDDVITNNEVFMLGLSNPTGAATETVNLDPFFDANGDGEVASTETATYSIATTHASLPLNMYHYAPDVGATTTTRSLVAENIENMVIRYYDKNDNPLPSAGPFDGNGEVVLPFTVPSSEWNDIRRVTIEVQARSNKPDPRGSTKTGTYEAGSIAAAVSGATTYSDAFFHASYSTNASPRNLVVASWGKIDMSPDPADVLCPTASMTVTANLVDENGAPVSGATMSFSSSDGSVSPATASTSGSGAASTAITYDWTRPSRPVTLSASTLVQINGEDHPVYSAMRVSFDSGDTAWDFDDGLDTGWTNDGGNISDFAVSTDVYKTSSAGIGTVAAGCAMWKEYVAQATYSDTGTGMVIDDYAGLYFRYTDVDNHYLARVRIVDVAGTATPTLELVKVETATETILGSVVIEPGILASYTLDTPYILKAYAEGTDLKVKMWDAGGTEPVDWNIEVTDATFTAGQIGLTTSVDTNVFDDVVIEPTTYAP